jgi:hypothetical protein
MLLEEEFGEARCAFLRTGIVDADFIERFG